MFEPPLRPQIEEEVLAGEEDVPCDALFNNIYVDKARLAANIRHALQIRSQISLDELVQQHPLEQGLAELVTYFSLAAEDEHAIIDDTQRQTLIWNDQSGHSSPGDTSAGDLVERRDSLLMPDRCRDYVPSETICPRF